MTFEDFIELLKNKNELIEINDLFDTDLQISNYSRNNLKKENKALLFNNIKNSNTKLITDIFSSKKRIDLALNNKSINEIAKKIFNATNNKFEFDYKNNFEKLNSNTSNIDLTKLSALKSYEKEGGRFFTFPCVITKSPITNKQNSGIYRLQLFNEKTLGMHWHTYKNEDNHFEIAKKSGMKYLEVAIVLGTHPINIIASALPFKSNFNEFTLYENIFDKPQEMIKCKTVDLYVPKDSNVVIEGIVKIGHYRNEGPFFMHNGKYDKVTMQPVFEATAIHIKDNAVIPATVTGVPPAENSIMMSYLLKIFEMEIKQDIEEIDYFHMPVEGVFNRILYLKLNDNIPVKKLYEKIKSQRILKNYKMIVLFDKSINFENRQQILWIIGNSVDKSVKIDKKIIIDTR